jgi:uncharacterized protein (DUF58 family)
MLVMLFGLWRMDFQAVAVGMVMALFLMVAYIRRFPRIEVTRRPSTLRVLEEDDFDMTLRVGSRNAWADNVEIYDQLPGYTRLSDGSNHMVLPLYKGEAREVVYSVNCPLRGAYRIGPLYVRTSDALGLFDDEQTIQDIYGLDVYPLYVELRTISLASRALKYNMGPVTVNELGRSTDFYSIREYIRGDPYKKINWKASAKLRKLMINEDEKETLSDCAIFVDSRTIAANGTPLDNFHETAVRATLGLARTLVQNKNRVMVVTYNDSVNIVPPGISRGHLGIINAMLVETVARGALTFDWAVGYAGPFLNPRTDVVVFSPLTSDMTFYPGALNLLRQGYRVVVVTAPTEEYEMRAEGLVSKRALLTKLQRIANVSELTAAGIPVVQVEPDEPQLSIIVRVSAALGGEVLDVASLEEESPEEVVPAKFEVEDAQKEPPGWLTSFWTEALGLRIDMPMVLLLQVLGLVALIVAAMLNFSVNEEFWEFLWEEGNFGQFVGVPTLGTLVLQGILWAWIINMGLGAIKVARERSTRPELYGLLYGLLLLLVIFFIARLIAEIDTAGGFMRLIQVTVISVPLFGALTIFRRVSYWAIFSIVFLLLLGLFYPNTMDEAYKVFVMALAVVAFMELAWAIERYDRLTNMIKDRASPRQWGLLTSTVGRYASVFSITLIVAMMVGMVLTGAPKWYVDAIDVGAPKPLEAESIFSPVYWLGWLAILAIVGRWLVLAFSETPRGRAMVNRMRKRLVIKRAPSGEPKGPADDLWDQEAPIPVSPGAPTAPVGGPD